MAVFDMHMESQSRQFDLWLTRTESLLGREMHDVLEEEAAQLAFAVARITPPTSGRMSFSEPWGVQKKAGVAAVRRDIYKVYATPAQVYGWLRERGEDGENAARGAAKAIRGGNVGELQRILYAFGMGDKAAGSLGEFSKTHHEAARSGRDGRVRGNSLRQIVKQSGPLTAYRKSEEKKVGGLKSGWAKASVSLSHKKRWPAWVLGAAGGSGYVINRAKDKRDPYISVVNTTGHAQGANATLRFTAIAVNYRQGVFVRKMKNKAKRMWKA